MPALNHVVSLMPKILMFNLCISYMTYIFPGSYILLTFYVPIFIVSLVVFFTVFFTQGFRRMMTWEALLYWDIPLLPDLGFPPWSVLEITSFCTAIIIVLEISIRILNAVVSPCLLHPYVVDHSLIPPPSRSISQFQDKRVPFPLTSSSARSRWPVSEGLLIPEWFIDKGVLGEKIVTWHLEREISYHFGLWHVNAFFIVRN